LRLQVATAAAIWRGDWTALQDAATTARTHGLARADLEEVLLQAVLFCGFPRVVTAFERLGEVWPSPAPPRGGALPTDAQHAAGAALFAAIYGRNTESVHALLASFHQEFHDFVLQAAYGRILTRPHLDARTREVLAVALLAAQDQERQFLGHARGARHFGASLDELREAIRTAVPDPATAELWCARLR
jgi:alkylhydroperoxidase/carboxymuconolactone decarboxylase family protein YurZ